MEGPWPEKKFEKNGEAWRQRESKVAKKTYIEKKEKKEKKRHSGSHRTFPLSGSFQKSWGVCVYIGLGGIKNKIQSSRDNYEN